MYFNKDNFNSNYLNIFKLNFLFFIIVSLIIQFLISEINIELVSILIIVFLSFLFLNKFIINKEVLQENFFGALIVLSLNFFYLSGPLIIKSFIFQEITSNLDVPLKSFFLAFIYQFVVILSFSLSRKLIRKNHFYSKSIFSDLRVFYFPNLKYSNFLFILFLLIKAYIIIFDYGSISSTNYGDVGMKFLYGIDLLFYLPLILYFNLFFFKKELPKIHFIFILLFYVFISFFQGILTNSRSIIFEGLFAIFISYILIFFFNFNFKVKKKHIIFIILLFLSLISLIEAASNRILESRSFRGDVTSLQLLDFVFKSSGDFKLYEQDINKVYKEDYTGNNILNRFAKIKFLDKSLFESDSLSISDKILFKSFSIKRLIGIFPQNIINIFDQNYNKIYYNKATGSYIEQLSGINFSGDLNRGSFIVELLLVTDSYLFTFFLIFLFYFIAFKILKLFQKINEKKIFFSPLIIMLIYENLYMTGSDNMLEFFTKAIRLPFQTIVLYYLITLFSKKSSPIPNNQ